MEIATYENFKKSLLKEIDRNFEFGFLSHNICVPYEAQDKKFSQKVTNFFSSRNISFIDLEAMDREFGRELGSAIMFLGWDAKRAMMGQFLRSGLDSYQIGHHFLEIIEHLLLNNHSSDDKSKTYYEWINDFNQQQKLVILNFIFLMRFDLLKIYLGTIFRDGFMAWAE